MSKKLVLVTAAALFDSDGRVLLAKRPEGKSMAGLWEFPGGKIEPNETPERALVREIAEELGVHISEAGLVPVTFASEALGQRHLLLLLYQCDKWAGEPQPLHAEELRWVTLDEMRILPMPPADAPFTDVLVTFTDNGAAAIT